MRCPANHMHAADAFRDEMVALSPRRAYTNAFGVIYKPESSGGYITYIPCLREFSKRSWCADVLNGAASGGSSCTLLMHARKSPAEDPSVSIVDVYMFR